jgi:hypothetical protein
VFGFGGCRVWREWLMVLGSGGLEDRVERIVKGF